jgi:hypothetical protein
MRPDPTTFPLAIPCVALFVRHIYHSSFAGATPPHRRDHPWIPGSRHFTRSKIISRENPTGFRVRSNYLLLKVLQLDFEQRLSRCFPRFVTGCWPGRNRTMSTAVVPGIFCRYSATELRHPVFDICRTYCNHGKPALGLAKKEPSERRMRSTPQLKVRFLAFSAAE